MCCSTSAFGNRSTKNSKTLACYSGYRSSSASGGHHTTGLSSPCGESIAESGATVGARMAGEQSLDRAFGELRPRKLEEARVSMSRPVPAYQALGNPVCLGPEISQAHDDRSGLSIKCWKCVVLSTRSRAASCTVPVDPIFLDLP